MQSALPNKATIIECMNSLPKIDMKNHPFVRTLAFLAAEFDLVISPLCVNHSIAKFTNKKSKDLTDIISKPLLFLSKKIKKI